MDYQGDTSRGGRWQEESQSPRYRPAVEASEAAGTGVSVDVMSIALVSVCYRLFFHGPYVSYYNLSPWAGGFTLVRCLSSRGWFPEAEGGNRPLRADLALWSRKWDDVRGYWSAVANLLWPIEHGALEGCSWRTLRTDSFLFCSCWQNELDRNISNLECVDWWLIGHQSWLCFTFISD